MVKRTEYSIIFIPVPFTKDAMYEAIDAGIKLILKITKGIPAQDMVEMLEYVKVKDIIIRGSNCHVRLSTIFTILPLKGPTDEILFLIF
ncbi:MAG: hypothetical protein ABDH49_01460 [Candidatus Hydrothermales bacterium]